MSTRARRLDAVTVALMLGASAVAHAGPGGFTFTPPPGWIDVSRGAPEAQRQKVPAALLARADNPGMAFYAVGPSAGDGFFENMNAIVETGKRAPLATPEGLAEMEKGLQAEFAKKGVTYRGVKAEVVKVAGVTSGRLVGEAQTANGLINLIQYAIPGDNALAMVTFTSPHAKLVQNEPIFDAAVQSTRGAVEPHRGSLIAGTAIGGALVGGIAGGIGALIAVLAKRRRKTAAAAAGPGSGPG
jgi:hypothetical protein